MSIHVCTALETFQKFLVNAANNDMHLALNLLLICIVLLHI